MNHRTWKMEICYSTPLTELRNEHNALCADWKQSSLEAERLAKANGDLCDKIAELERPIRVSFSDAVIEKMAEGARQAAGSDWPNAIRAALAAGGLEPCAVPDYAPEDVAFPSERASDEELGQFIHDKWFDCEDDPSEWRKEIDSRKREWTACAAAIRARVEAPLLAEIARLEAGMERQREAIRDREKGELDACAEIAALRAQLEAVTAERDEARQEQDNLIFQRNDFRHWHMNEQKKVADLTAEIAALRQPTSTPTDAEVEALAKSMHAKTRFIGWNEMIDAGRESWRNSARAAYAHIGRVPVGAELDVTADEALRVYSNGGKSIGGMHNTLDLCRSRIKPVYECKECAKLVAKIMKVNEIDGRPIAAEFNAAKDKAFEAQQALNEAINEMGLGLRAALVARADIRAALEGE